MNEQLVVKNFGPIKDATVDFKRVTVFIGPAGGGKSTLAKLAAIFRDIKFHYSTKFDPTHFSEYALDKYFSEGHYLAWSIGNNGVSIKDKTAFLSDGLAESTGAIIESSSDEAIEVFTQQLVNDFGKSKISFEQLKGTESFKEAFEEFFRKKILADAFSKTIAHSKPDYIPSERLIVASLEYSWAGLMRDDIGLPKTLLDFANSFSLARRNVSELEIPLFNVKYLHINGRDFIKIPDCEEPLMLLETASGIQSVTQRVASFPDCLTPPSRPRMAF